MLDFGIEFYIKQNTSDISKLKNELNNISKNSKNAETGINSLTSSIKGLAAAGAGFVGISMLTSTLKEVALDTVNVAASFEKMKLTLDTLEGSSVKADKSFAWIKDFAKKTPYEVKELTESFIRLKAYGIDPTNGTLATLGDTASAFGRPIMSAVEMMADAMQGSNERLKEYGITATSNGDKIGYAWTDSSGKSKIALINNNAEIIKSTLLAIFNNSYQGNMDKLSGSYDGMISNIKDSYSQMQDSFMKNTGLFDVLKEELEIISAEFNRFSDNKEGMYDLANATRQFMSDLLKLGGSIAYVKDAFSLGLKVISSYVINFINVWKQNFEYLDLITYKTVKSMYEMMQAVSFKDYSNEIGDMNSKIDKSSNYINALKNEQVELNKSLLDSALLMNKNEKELDAFISKLQVPLTVSPTEKLAQEVDIFTDEVRKSKQEFDKLLDSIEKSGSEDTEIKVKVKTEVGKEGTLTDLKEEMKKTSDSILDDLENYYTTMKDYETSFAISVSKSNQELIKRGNLTTEQINQMNEKQKIEFDKDQKARIKSELKEELDAKNEILDANKEYYSVVKNYEEQYRIQLEQDKMKWQELGLTQEQIQEMAIVKQKEYAEEAKKARDEDLKKIQTVENGIETFYRQLETETKNVSETTTSLLLDITDALNSGFVNFFDGTSKKFGDFKELTKSIFTDIIKSIQEMIIKMTVAQTMQYAMQSAGFGGGYSDKGSFSFSDFFGFAKGGAFSGGVQAFATGGAFTNSIATSPTMAPMALFGEAGPEAIMPLTRTSNGSLGVVAQTNGGANVIINNYSASSISSSKDGNGNTVLTIEDVIGTVSKQLQSGRGSIADSLSGSYNIARR